MPVAESTSKTTERSPGTAGVLSEALSPWTSWSMRERVPLWFFSWSRVRVPWARPVTAPRVVPGCIRRV